MPRTVQRDEGRPAFGAWMAAQRKARGWSQADLAERLGYAPGVVQAWERGRLLPLRWQVAELIAAFGARDWDAREWYWRAGYVPPDLWGLIDGLPGPVVVGLSVQRPAQRGAGA
jgi:transcriptional regulator with XRE-family HTH domain